MGDIKKILTTVLVAMGIIAVINRIPQLRHAIKGETTFVNGRRVENPKREWVGQ